MGIDGKKPRRRFDRASGKAAINVVSAWAKEGARAGECGDIETYSVESAEARKDNKSGDKIETTEGRLGRELSS